MIIGLSGQAGSGKDYIANILVEKYQFVKIAFADPLKKICQDIFEFSDDQLWGSSEKRNEPDERYVRSVEGTEQYLTVRHALQSIGDWGRNCYPNIWVDTTLKTARQLLSKPKDMLSYPSYTPKDGVKIHTEMEGDYRSAPETAFSKLPRGVVVSDLRYLNEIKAIKQEGGKVVRIYRNKQNTLSATAALHSSECDQKNIPNEAFDFILNNEEDPALLINSIERMMILLRK